MDEVFLDTAALVALANKSDSLHRAAVLVRQELSASGVRNVTSHWVLIEFLNALSAATTRAAALRTVDALQQSERTSILEASAEGWRAALDFYRRRTDK